jgi:acid phosphatase
MKLLVLFALILLAQTSFADPLPRPDHIVIVINENKAFQQIIGNQNAPYINSLAQRGMLFTESYGVTHPSQPNYLALFSGSTHNIINDSCLLELKGDNLASDLISHDFSFTSFSETMPDASYLGCMSGPYMRKHNPLSNWLELAKFNQPFSAFPQDFSKLPTVSLVVPNQQNDMHDGTIEQGDRWLSQNLELYAQWALTNNSLLIVTWDEDNGSAANHIATIFVGEMIKSGKSSQRINHYTILRTISDLYGLPSIGNSAGETAITDVWKKSVTKH